jgi:hypothetical protein
MVVTIVVCDGGRVLERWTLAGRAVPLAARRNVVPVHDRRDTAVALSSTRYEFALTGDLISELVIAP